MKYKLVAPKTGRTDNFLMIIKRSLKLKNYFNQSKDNKISANGCLGDFLEITFSILKEPTEIKIKSVLVKFVILLLIHKKIKCTANV